MIGDAPPHEVKDYPAIIKQYRSVVTQAIDWREECDKLLDIVSQQVTCTYSSACRS